MSSEYHNDHKKLCDGFGNEWVKCFIGKDCGLEIVRPGKVQCECDETSSLNFTDIKRLMIAHHQLSSRVDALIQQGNNLTNNKPHTNEKEII